MSRLLSACENGGSSPTRNSRVGACAGGWIVNASLDASALVISVRFADSSSSTFSSSSPDAGFPW